MTQTMAIDGTNDLDRGIRSSVQELESMEFQSPEIMLLLGTGTGSLSSIVEEPLEIPCSELPGAPMAWQGAQILAGRVSGARIWAITDEPDPDPVPWARAWPIWLSRAAGAGSCLVTAAGSMLPGSDADLPEEGLLLV